MPGPGDAFLVEPGDLIVGDFDGVVAIPAQVAGEVVRLATGKASRENTTRVSGCAARICAMYLTSMACCSKA